MKGSDNPTPTKKTNIKQFFQRSYYDHIIRNEYSLFKIREYIKNNQANWQEDRNNGGPKRIRTFNLFNVNEAL